MSRRERKVKIFYILERRGLLGEDVEFEVDFIARGLQTQATNQIMKKIF